MRLSIPALSFLCVVLLGACARQTDATSPAASAPPSTQGTAMSALHDEHSRAEPDKVRIDDLALDLALDFDQRTLSGTAT